MMTTIYTTRGQEVKHYSHVSRRKISMIGGLPGTVRGSYDRSVTLVLVLWSPGWPRNLASACSAPVVCPGMVFCSSSGGQNAVVKVVVSCNCSQVSNLHFQTDPLSYEALVSWTLQICHKPLGIDPPCSAMPAHHTRTLQDTPGIWRCAAARPDKPATLLLVQPTICRSGMPQHQLQ
jgi:hypothetical protein